MIFTLDITLLLGAVLEEGVHQLGVNEISGLQRIKDIMAAMMSNAAEDSQTSHEDSVVVVAESPVLDQSHQSVESSQFDELVTHDWVGTQPGTGGKY